VKRILIVEDDENLSRGIAFTFEKDGYSVVSAGTLTDGRRLCTRHHVDMIILDIGLPDGDGIEFCKTIREKSNVLIIMLTARDMETDEVSGLSAGADDYITKPFSLSVLRARVETLFRRSTNARDTFIRSGQFQLDGGLGKLYRGNDEIPVSGTEFRLLRYFIENAGQVLSKEQILAALWDSRGNYVDENALQVNISRLRSKIEDEPKSPRLLKTVHGMGYIWTAG
jgi:DNA-binding response OmpR family regulator